MKILLCPNSLLVGGSPLVALDVAAVLRRRGHEIVVYSSPGPLESLATARGLTVRTDPSFGTGRLDAIRRCWRLARREGVDLVHTYEDRPTIEAFLGAHLLGGLPLVASWFGVKPPTYFPGSVPLVVGHRHVYDWFRSRRAGPVWCCGHPVDVYENDPPVDPADFRARHQLGDRLVVLPSRLAGNKELDAIEATIDAVADRLTGAQLAIVGDGAERDRIAGHAARANARAGRRAVVLTGEMLDPRPAYAAATVVIAEATSAVRGAIYEKPVVVLGTRGFAELLGPDSAAHFDRHGAYGAGDGTWSSGRIAELLTPLVTDVDEARRFGSFARHYVVERYAPEIIAAPVEQAYGSARPPGRAALADAAVIARVVGGGRLRRARRRLAGPRQREARTSHEASV